MDDMMGRTKLENIGKIIGEDAEKLLKAYLKEIPTGKLAIEYEGGSLLYLEILPDNWVRYKKKLEMNQKN